MYNSTFNDYQPVDMNGRFLHLVSDVLHKSIDAWTEIFLKKVFVTKSDNDLAPEEKKDVLETIKLTLKQINTATKAIETTTFIKNVIEQIVSKLVMTKEEQEKLNYLDNYLNFRNGKLNLKTNEFSERTEDDNGIPKL